MRGRLALGTLALLLLVAAPAAADPVSGGSFRLPLRPQWFASLHAAGVQLSAVAPARAQGRHLYLPVQGGRLENGVGRLRLGGGLRLAVGRRGAVLRDLVVDTARGVVRARLGGAPVLLASSRRPRVQRQDFGFEATLGKLVLGAGAARRLDRALGLDGLLEAEDVLGNGTAGARLATLAVPRGRAFLSLDEGFLAKLRSLQVSADPFGAAWFQSKAPLTFALTGVQGEIAPDGLAGTLASPDGIRFTQAGGSTASEVALLGLSLDVASGAVGSDVRAQPLGAGEEGTIAGGPVAPNYRNAFTGEIAVYANPLTLAPGLARLLDRAFSEPRGLAPVFAAGEPLGQLSVQAQTHGRLAKPGS